jgi:hypothetical protein
MPAGIEDERHQDRVVGRRKRDVIQGEELRGVLDVVADLEHRIALDQRFHQCERALRQNLPDGVAGLGLLERQRALGAALAVRDRHVTGFARAEGEREADEAGAHRIGPGRLDGESENAALPAARDPRLERGFVLNEHIARAIDGRRRRRRGLRRCGHGRFGPRRRGGIRRRRRA